MLYDFTKPEDIPHEVRGTFDMVVVDPPFITKEVRGVGPTGSRAVVVFQDNYSMILVVLRGFSVSIVE